MTLTVDPSLVAAFGGATRVLTLGALANANGPLTGYRVAKLIDGQRTKVYSELERLAGAGLVRKESSPTGPITWQLQDKDIADLLRKRVKISSMEDWLTTRDAQTSNVAVVLQLLSRTPTLGLDGLTRDTKIRNPRELARPKRKDELLTELGLRPSRRRRSRG